jgi:hypothetical protein
MDVLFRIGTDSAILNLLNYSRINRVFSTDIPDRAQWLPFGFERLSGPAVALMGESAEG